LSNPIPKGHLEGRKEGKVHFQITMQVFKTKDVKTIVVPQYEELSSEKIYPRVKGYLENMPMYFPDYKDGYVPPRKFFWDIFNTLDNEMAESFVNFGIQQRNESDAVVKDEIEIEEDIYKEITSNFFHSRKKGRALSMLASNKDYSNVSRKRKRKYLALGESKDEEEKEDNRSKRMKKFDTENESFVTLPKRKDMRKSMDEIIEEMDSMHALHMNADGDQMN
jgi:hypothetical protein